MAVRKYNRIVWVVEYTWAAGNQGWNKEAVEVQRYKKWAHVENRTGSNSFPYGQQVWQYDYKIMMRFERTRPTKSNFMIEYAGKQLKIESLSIDSEGYKDEEVCRCSVVDEVVTTGSSS